MYTTAMLFNCFSVSVIQTVETVLGHRKVWVTTQTKSNFQWCSQNVAVGSTD